MTTASWPAGDATLSVPCTWSAAVVAPDGTLLWATSLTGKRWPGRPARSRSPS
ncbi:MAG: hypothetical protein U0232_01850 [Thermomicrobiales bacterium]